VEGIERVLTITEASPELQFAAAMLASSVDEARAGDPRGPALEGRTPSYLTALCPAAMDPATIHAALLSVVVPTKPWQVPMFEGLEATRTLSD
jgi:hypothetical protein